MVSSIEYLRSKWIFLKDGVFFGFGVLDGGGGGRDRIGFYQPKKKKPIFEKIEFLLI